MSKTMKTLLGTILCLCLTLGVMLCMGVSASAEETKTGYGVTINGTETIYTNYFDALYAAEAVESATIILYQDVPDNGYRINSGNITLNLNGFTYGGRLLVNGCNLTVIDTASTKGTVLNIDGAAIEYYSGNLTIDASVDCTGESEGHEAWLIFKPSSVTDVVTIGSTGTENVVLPKGVVAVDSYGSITEVSVVESYNEVLHRHSWIEGGCVVDDTCSGCDTIVAAPGHSYDAATGNCSTCGAGIAEAFAGNGTTFTPYLTIDAAIDAAEADTAITYIKLNKDVTVSDWLYMRSGAFTVDLNGYTITLDDVNNGHFCIYGADVTFVDSSTTKTGAVVVSANRTNDFSLKMFDVRTGKLTLSGGSYSYTHSHDVGMNIYGGTVTIQDGVSFSGDPNSGFCMLHNYGGTLIIEGGSFTGALTAVGSSSGTTTIKGGSFAGAKWANIYYQGGTIDLSAMGDNAVGMTIRSLVNASVEDTFTLGDGQVIVDRYGNVVTSITDTTNSYTVAAAVEISFDANGGSGSMDSVSIVTGNYTLPECGFTAPAGKMFVGWTDVTGTDWYPPESSMDITGDTTLYALWVDIVTISFDANGGTGTMDPIECVGYIKMPSCGFTAPAKMAFVGWSDSADGEVMWSAGDEWFFEANVTLYAVWETDSIYVGGVKLDSGMYLAVGSTEPTDTKPTGGYAYYENGVLTLNNYTYEGEGYLYYVDGNEYCYYAAIYADKSVTLMLKGENSLTLTSESGDGISVEGSLTIDGSGSLNITSTCNGIYVEASDAKVVFGGSASLTLETGNNEGVYIYGDDVELEIGDDFQLTIGTEDTPVGEEAICVYSEYTSSVTITDNAKVSIVTSDEEAIYAESYEDYSSITISGNPKLNLIAEENALDAYDIYIHGGTIYAEGGEGYNTIEADGDVEISGGHITVKGDNIGIYADDDIFISGGYVVAEGYYYGIYAYDDLQIYGVGTEVIASCDDENGDDAIYSSEGYLYIDDDIDILIPEDGYADDYRINDANGEWVSSVHLNYDGYYIYVGGVGMADGDYLDSNGNISDTKPAEGGYAYFTYSAITGGVLTLHDYDYYGDAYIEDWDNCYGIATELGNLTIVLEGYNEIDTDYYAYSGIFVTGDVTFTGSGALMVNAYDYGISVFGDITVDGAFVDVSAEYYAIYDYTEDLTVKNGGFLQLNSLKGDDIYVQNLILDRGSLIIDGSYLFVAVYDEWYGECIPGTITLNGTVLYTPYDGYIDEGYDYYDNHCTTVYDEYGDFAYHIAFYADGWCNYWGEWYYYDAENDEWAEGLVRVPYPPCDIDGVTYGPNQDAMDYCEGKGETFIDAEEGWFYFDEEGVFMSDYTGIDEDSGMYFENGFAVWHPGFLVDEEDNYYYFIGDVVNGGNVMATGDVYVSVNNTEREFVIGGVYTFDEDGILCEYDGITEVNGVLRYYENAQLMLGKGLIQGMVSDGTCSVTLESYGSSKMNVIMVVREFLGLGLLETKELVESAPVLLTGSMTKDQAERFVAALQAAGATASMVDNLAPGGYCYVTSDGSLVVNANYWVAKTNGFDIAAGAYDFDENGYLVNPVSTDKNGIYFENGAWYYYENGKIGYNKGLIYVNTTWYGADGSENVYSGYIYVRSSGVLATGSYYITNVENDNSGLFITGQKVAFSDIGIADMPKHGIVDVDGTLYFYQYNAIQYNAGLIEHNGGWIYVRSNGQLAVGPYWITNHNGLLPEDMYIFSEDGILTIN